MRLGVFAPLSSPLADPAYVRAFGETAEGLGFDSLWVAEHVVLFDEYASRYPYAADGRIPGRPTSGVLEPLTTLAYLAACTSRIRLGTGILLLAAGLGAGTVHVLSEFNAGARPQWSINERQNSAASPRGNVPLLEGPPRWMPRREVTAPRRRSWPQPANRGGY